eukprot:5307162-Pleurochrysis_carterae.AAC.1
MCAYMPKCLCTYSPACPCDHEAVCPRLVLSVIRRGRTRSANTVDRLHGWLMRGRAWRMATASPLADHTGAGTHATMAMRCARRSQPL